MKQHILALLFLPILGSCEVSHYKAVNIAYNANGSMKSYKLVEEPLMQLAGTRTTNRSDGSSTTNDYQVSWQQFMQLAGTGFGSWSAASISKATNLYNQFKEGQITQRQATAGLQEIAKLEAGSKVTPVEAGTSIFTPNGGLQTAAPVP